MPENIDTQVRSLELTGNVPPHDPVELEVPREGELEVREVTGRVFMRINNRDQERRPLRRGETLCWAGDVRVRRLLFDNGDGDGGSVEYEVRVGYTVRGFGGSEGISGLPQPRRLASQLAEDTVISDGEAASEEVQTSTARRRLRVRAKVSGIGGLTQVGAVSDATNIADAVGIAVAPDHDLAFTAGFTGTIGVLDITDPASPTVLTSLTHANLDTLVDCVWDETNDKLYVIGDDGSDHTLFVIDVDVSTDPPTLTLEGQVAYGASAGTVGISNGSHVSLDEAEGLVVAGDDSGPRNVLVDVSTPAAPSVVAGYSPGNNRHALDPERGVFYTSEGNDLAAIRYSTGGLARTSLTSIGFSLGGRGPHRVDVDDAIAVFDDSPNNFLRFVDVSDELAPVLLGSFDYGVTTIEGLWIDPDTDRVFFTEGGRMKAVTYSDPSDPQQSANVNPANMSIGREIRLDDDGNLYTTDNLDDEVIVVADEPGRDVLRLAPLLADGSRATTGEVTATLRDLEEVLLDLDIEGESAVDVEVEALTPGEATTVEYVDIFER